MNLFRAGPSGAVAAAVAVLMASPAFAQSKPYDTPLYTPPAQEKVDPNFGLPTFGMPGADMPKQQATAPVTAPPGTGAPGTEAPVTETPGTSTASTHPELDFFKGSNGGATSFSDVVLPSERNKPLAGASSTTPPSSTVASTPGPGDAPPSATMETPSYTTSEGTVTEDTTPSYTTK